MKLKYYLLIIGLLLLESCTNNKHDSSIVMREKTTRNIALFIPRSGFYKNLGTAVQNAIEISFFKNNRGNFSISIYDTEKMKSEIIRASQKKHDIVLGPILSKNISPILGLAKNQDILTLAFSNDIFMKNNGLFILGFDYFFEATSILSYAILQGKKDIVAIIPNNFYGKIIEKAIRQIKYQYHVAINILKYKEDIDDITKKISLLKVQEVDCIFIPEGSKNLSRIISAMLYHEVDLDNIQFIGTSLWDNSGAYNNHVLRGAWIPLLVKRNTIDFISRYRKNYKYSPDKVAYIAYDIMNAIFLLDAISSDQFTKQRLISRSFNGINGTFKLRNDGLISREISIARVNYGNSTIIKHIGH